LLKKILKILLIIIGVAVLAIMVALLTINREWPWWYGLTLMAGILGLFMGLVFLKRYYMRRREKKFVRRIVELDDAAIKMAPIHERQQLQDLQQHWKESVDLLHDSYLRKKGNPLYVLPWYLIVGKTGTGKTSAIVSARLSSPLTAIGRQGQIPSTSNCDWWFLKEAIILDSAGRYTVPLDEFRDKEEWEKFLSLIAKYRRREPLNGVIVTVSAEDLKAVDNSKLREEGQNIRKRIDQLMRVVGAKFPIYVLVTKMDLVYGFTSFFDALPESEITQAMGFMNRSLNPYWSDFLEKAWLYMSQRLRDLRLTFISQLQAGSPPCLIFPSEFDKLKPGLVEFSKAVFEENPYQETPLFRGLYFSSATQEGCQKSDILDFVQVTPKIKSTNENCKCQFIVDLFKEIIPSDRFLFRPILEFIRWRRITRSSALLAWLFICLSLSGVLTISYIHNRIIIDKFRTEFARLPALSSNGSVNSYGLDKLRREILSMEKANHYWLLPHFGLMESRELEMAMKRKYVELFEEGVEKSFDGDTLRSAAELDEKTPEDKVATYISYLVARINILGEYGKNGKVSPTKHFKQSAAELLVLLYPQLPPYFASLYADNYYAFLEWRGDRQNSQAKREIFQNALVSLQCDTFDLKWLVQKWIPDAPSVTIKDFWGEPESKGYDDQVPVPGAYTNLGRKHIQTFIDMIEEALPGKNVLVSKKADFWNWYQEEYLRNWSDFVRHFDDGRLTLETPSSQQNAAVLMTTDHSPYFSLINRVADEMSWIHVDQLPPWVALFIEFNEVQKLAKSETMKTKGSLWEKLSAEKEEITQRYKTDMENMAVGAITKRESMARVWQDYVASLDKISPAATSSDVDFVLVYDFFTLPSDMTGPSNSTIYLAYNNYLKMKSLVQMKGDLSDVWNIVLGPIDYLLEFCIKKAACHLNQRWDRQVLGGLLGASRDKFSQLLFDPTGGLVGKFLDGPAKPFIEKSKSGYFARRASIKEGVDLSIPFTPDFLNFLTKGAEGMPDFKPEYLVQMETLPINVNSDAALDPNSNILTLQCMDGPVQLKNFNYPQKATFRWSPDKCADATIQIQFPDITLTKVYEGRLGFASLLSDFKHGSHTFTADDFPEAESRLKRLGVSSIKVAYKIKGSKPVIKLLEEIPQVPQEITFCESK
jgi:type VI secretion system protein ImpL